MTSSRRPATLETILEHSFDTGSPLPQIRQKSGRFFKIGLQSTLALELERVFGKDVTPINAELRNENTYCCSPDFKPWVEFQGFQSFAVHVLDRVVERGLEKEMALERRRAGGHRKAPAVVIVSARRNSQ
jgi:hypothetical protein